MCAATCLLKKWPRSWAKFNRMGPVFYWQPRLPESNRGISDVWVFCLVFIEQISTKISIFSRKNHHFWVKILFFSLETYRNVQRKIQFSKNPIFPGCNRRQWRGAPLRRQAEFVRFHAHLLRRLFDETWTAGGKLRVCWSSLNFIETK